MTTAKRPNWKEYFAEIVNVTARRSSCARLHVGCLLVKDNRIISQGYNGYLPGCKHEQKMRNGHEMATITRNKMRSRTVPNEGLLLGCGSIYHTLPMHLLYENIMCVWNKRIYYIHDYKNDKLVDYFSIVANVPIEQIQLC